MTHHKETGISLLTISLRGGGAERQSSLLAKSGLLDHLFILENKVDYAIDMNRVVCLSSKPSMTLWAKLWAFPASVWKLGRRLSGTQCLISFMEQSNIVNILSKLIHQHRAVVSIRTSVFALRPAYRLVMRLLYPCADHIVVNSEGSKQALLQHFKWKPTRVSVIYNGLDMPIIRAALTDKSPKDFPYIVWCGRLIKHKNPIAMIKIFASLKQNPLFADYHLVMLGHGPLLARLQDLATTLGIKNHVHFEGFSQNPYHFYAHAALFVHLSEVEGFPNVLLEAMACEKAVIAVDCEFGPREVLDPNLNVQSPPITQAHFAEFGVLVPVIWHQDSMAVMTLTPNEQIVLNALCKLLSSPDLLTHYAKQSTKRSKTFSMDSIIQQWQHVAKT